MMGDLDKILITGASQGIGRRLALHFAGKGSEVWIAARNEAALEETARMAADAGGVCHVAECDLRNRASLERLATAVGDVDCLIHNAADVTSRPLTETSLEEIESIVATNITGPLELTRLLLPGMRARNRGTIVTISSLAGYKPNPSQTVYSISKSAVNAMAAALRAELRGTGIRVIHLALGSVSVDDAPKPGQVPVRAMIRKLDQALERGTPEVFMSPVSKWLMRVYAAAPWLAR